MLTEPSAQRWLVSCPLHARVGVKWLWRIDVRDETLQVLELMDGIWAIRATCSDETAVRLPPFEAIEIPLARMWVRAG